MARASFAHYRKLFVAENENRSLSRPARASQENVIARFATGPLRCRSVG